MNVRKREREREREREKRALWRCRALKITSEIMYEVVLNCIVLLSVSSRNSDPEKEAANTDPVSLLSPLLHFSRFFMTRKMRVSKSQTSY